MIRKEIKAISSPRFKWFVEEPELSDFQKELWELISSAEQILVLTEQINYKLDKEKVSEWSKELKNLKDASSDIKNRVKFLGHVARKWRNE